MRRAQIVVVGLAALVWIAPVARGESRPRPQEPPDVAGPTSAPASQPVTTRPAEKLAALLRAIRQAAHPGEVISAYARGCAIDRLNAELQNAYMRRMLQFGHPLIAYYPARVLVRIEPKNGTAWGVVGYVYGKRSKLRDALVATVRAAGRCPDDPSILHNAGQLVAWYEGQGEPPKLPAATERLAERLRKPLSQREPFSRAYEKIKAVYAERDQQADKIQGEIEVVEAEIKAARDDAELLDRRLRGLHDEIKHRKRTIGRLRVEMWQLEHQALGTIRRRRRYAELRERVRQQRRAIDGAETRSRQARGDGEAAITRLKRKIQELHQLGRQLQGVMAKTKLPFRWDPPAVDGVVTPEDDRAPLKRQATTAPGDPESAAQRRLAMARLYLNHGMAEKGAAILRDIVASYRSTRAGKAAKLLLKGLKLPAKPRG